MEPFQTLWTCLVSKPASSQPNISLEKSESIKPTKSFAKALNEVCDIALSQLPHSIIKMYGLSITIPEDEYFIRVKACKHNLYWFFGLKNQIQMDDASDVLMLKERNAQLDLEKALNIEKCPKPKKENQSGGKVFALSGSETSADDRLIRGT
ncbi:hypothetical protein KIW84_011777 [Lathyrus oleraceus]|uniref:Uncharacterized protein n=1 Tax=Pisum sativum TaxID=3888 RepID=A0A9D5GV78_PEA|nr:hypothetical protein KIW84_011777 [Pisum sativum]